MNFSKKSLPLPFTVGLKLIGQLLFGSLLANTAEGERTIYYTLALKMLPGNEFIHLQDELFYFT